MLRLCAHCGGDAPRKPSITEDGKCDLCQKPVIRAEDKGRTRCGVCGGEAPRQPEVMEDGTCEFCSKQLILK